MRVAMAAGVVCLCTAVAAQQLQYPATRKIEQVDTYHGVKVLDPYRWLEDDNSTETAAWVEAENKVTLSYLDQIPYRKQLHARVKQLNDYAKYSSPFHKGPYYFFSKNDGLQNQSVLYIQKGLDGKPEVLIDPNTWSEDGTMRLSAFAPSSDARYAVYGISRSGSDWQEYRVMELAGRKTLDDTLQWVKVSNVAWQKEGFYYSRYPAPAGGQEKASINEDHRVYFHRVGTPQSEDQLIFEDLANPQRFHVVSTTKDERFVVLSIADRGKGKDGNALSIRDTARGDREFTPMIPTISDDSFEVIDHVGDKLLVETNRKAPNGRVVLIDPRQPDESRWTTVLAERREPLQSATTAGGRLFATYLQDVATHAYVFDLDGTRGSEIPLPGPGVGAGFRGEPGDAFVFYAFNSLSVPPAIYRYDIATRKSAVFRQAEVPGYKADAFETKQVFYSSKDGTKVPMFLVYRKGLKLDGTNPTLLYAYGGFNIVQSPTFSAARLALLEQGFVYASANVRGGGEYGEAWHQAGTKLRKQNVFDDFIAAAEWLISNKYVIGTARDSGRIERRPAGGSNHQPAAGTVPGGDPGSGRHGHAAVPEIHHRLELDRGLRLQRGRRRLQGAPCLFAAAQYQAGREVPRHARHHRRSRRPRRTGALVQVRSDAAGACQPRQPRPDPDRNKIGPRCEQPAETAGDDGRHLHVHPL